MFGGKQPLMLHLFTTTKNALLSTFGLELCVIFWLGLTCYPHHFSTQICWCVFGGNSTRISGRNLLGTQEKHMVPSQRVAAHFSRHVREHLSATYNDCWYARGLASLVTGPHTVGLFFFVRLHKKKLHSLISSWFWRGSYCSYRWSSKNIPGRHLEILSARVNIRSVIVDFVLTSVAVRWIVCSKLLGNTTLSKYFSGFAWFPTLFRPRLIVTRTASTERHIPGCW
jgi:hypothetical protein